MTPDRQAVADTTTETSIGRDYRYPGPSSFEDRPQDQEVFFGRDTEITHLTDLIAARRLVIVYGKSGLGKTSLLQAGVFPRLRERAFLPLRVRVNRREGDPIRDLIDEICETARQRTRLNPTGESTGLWEFFKGTVFWRDDAVQTPVLVLDQFEELFTLQTPEGRLAIAHSLGDLAGTGLPETVRERKRAGVELPYTEAPPDLRIVLGLREDYVGTLQALFPNLPGILTERFRLTALNAEQARAAIVNPARLDEARFATRPFDYAPVTLDLILNYLARDDAVEPFQLQIVFSYIEQQVQGSLAAISLINEWVIKNERALERILKKFYARAMPQCFPGRGYFAWRKRSAVRRLCEEGLLTTEGHRDSLGEEKIKRQYGIDEQELAVLVDAKLLRREPRLRGFAYELTNDSLAQAIAGAKAFRISKKFWDARVGLGVLLIMLLWQIRAKNESLQSELLRAKATETELTRQLELAGEIKRATEDTIGVLKKLLTDLPGINRQHLAAEVTRQLDGAVANLSAVRTKTAAQVLEPEMVEIPPGSFNMGSPDGEPDHQSDESPVHPVNIKRFKFGRYEVTFAEYDAFALATGRALPDDEGWGRERRPVIDVSRNDAQAYAQWLSERTGKRYRLPTEAEWEYAARAGTTSARFWGDRAADACQYANVDDNAHGCTDGYEYSAPVGKFKPNDFGQNDILGNVWEWVQDCYHENYEGAPTDGAAWEENGCAERVMRGGSWVSDPRLVRSAYRGRHSPDFRFYFIGFRLAQDI